MLLRCLSKPAAPPLVINLLRFTAFQPHINLQHDKCGFELLTIAQPPNIASALTYDDFHGCGDRQLVARLNFRLALLSYYKGCRQVVGTTKRSQMAD